MLSDQDLAAALDSLPGERITAEYITSRITLNEVIYPPMTPTVTIVTLGLDNGFTVRGESACVDPASFDRDIGYKLARDDAFRKLWPLFGFLLAEKRYQNSQPCADTANRGTPAERAPTFSAVKSATEHGAWAVVRHPNNNMVVRFYGDDAEIRARAHAEACNADVASEQAAEEVVYGGPRGGAMADTKPCTIAAPHTYGLSFGGAIAWMKDGAKVARTGWNGKGMHLALAVESNSKLAVQHPGDVALCVKTLPHIVMLTAQGRYIPWLASQADMLTSDWEVVG